jgi:hypothetical protein
MPFVLNAGVNYAGDFFAPGSVVSDEIGAAMLVEHPSSLSRVLHDDDLCAAMDDPCDAKSHPWNAASAKPAPSNALTEAKA